MTDVCIFLVSELSVCLFVCLSVQAADPVLTAQQYRDVAYQSYLDRISES